LQNCAADSLLTHALDEILYYPVVDVGFKECQPNLTQGLAYIGFGQLAPAFETPENIFES
jgi:hypothetical protein